MRTGIVFGIGYILLVLGVAWLVFGNPFTVEGERATQLSGYLVAQAVSAAVMLAVFNCAILRSSVSDIPTPKDQLPR